MSNQHRLLGLGNSELLAGVGATWRRRCGERCTSETAVDARSFQQMGDAAMPGRFFRSITSNLMPGPAHPTLGTSACYVGLTTSFMRESALARCISRRKSRRVSASDLEAKSRIGSPPSAPSRIQKTGIPMTPRGEASRCSDHGSERSPRAPRLPRSPRARSGRSTRHQTQELNEILGCAHSTAVRDINDESGFGPPQPAPRDRSQNAGLSVGLRLEK